MNRSMVLCLLAAVSSGCLDRELTPINPCLVSTVSRKVTVTGINKVDLLFMVDNSASMTSKQNSLKAQFPRMIQVLSTGMRTGNDPYPFPPVRDMHLAVVSSDMGVVGQSGIMGCDPNGGDDGRLQYTSSGDPGCQASYPPFLSYDATRDNPMQIGVDFECIASLGSLGYNYENQLESAFKALRNSRCPDRSRRRPRPARNERGGVNCKVDQLPVTTPNIAPSGAGWFYDTFSSGVMAACPHNRLQRVSFTESAMPADGTVVKLECLNEVQSLPDTRTEVSAKAGQPPIGSACSSVTQSNGKAVSVNGACAVQLVDGTTARLGATQATDARSSSWSLRP